MDDSYEVNDRDDDSDFQLEPVYVPIEWRSNLTLNFIRMR